MVVSFCFDISQKLFTLLSDSLLYKGKGVIYMQTLDTDFYFSKI